MKRTHCYFFFIFLWEIPTVHAMLEGEDDLASGGIVETIDPSPLYQSKFNPERPRLFSQKDPIPEKLVWQADLLACRYIKNQRTFATIGNPYLNIFEDSCSDSSFLVDYFSQCFNETQPVFLGTAILSVMVMYPMATKILFTSGSMDQHINRFSLCGGWWVFFWFKSEMSGSGYPKASILFFACILNQRFHEDQKRTINFLDKADYLWEHSGDELKILARPPEKDPLESVWKL
ncbi:MAG: hypothetical protein LBF76_00845 [Holosporales bacterium]|jgi:hypothetical protein|nr:hypothetical protein [Holosporales bacterium]